MGGPGSGRPRVVDAAYYWPYTSRRMQDKAKRLAQRAVGKEIASGRLTRQPCEVCGSKRRHAEAHHDDYGKPLDIRWLCRQHHREHHKRLAASANAPALMSEVQEVRTRVNAGRVKADTPTSRAVVMSVTEQLLSRMDADGISMAELGRRLGTSRQATSCHFHGGIRSIRTLAGIADALELDVTFAVSARACRRSA